MSKLLALLAFVLTACGTPTQNDPVTYGTFYVAIAPMPDGSQDFDSQRRDQIARAVDYLDTLGPDFVLVSSTDPRAMVSVRRVETMDCRIDGGGSYDRGANFVRVDYACATSVNGFEHIVAHELMHWYLDRSYGFGGHICRTNEDPAGLCHPTVHGVALLNPYVSYVEDPLDPEWIDGRPTTNDLQLVRLLAGR